MSEKEANDVAGVAMPVLPPLEAHYRRILEALDGAKPSRRTLLAGLGASAVGLPLVGGAARAASRFRVLEGDGHVRIDIGDAPAWELDTKWFDGRPVLRVQSRPDALHIKLTGALFPGTSLPANIEVRAVRRGSSWPAKFNLPGLGFEASVRLELWLLGTEAARAPFRVTGFGLHATPDLSFARIAGFGSLGADWTFRADALEKGDCLMQGACDPIEEWRFALVPQGEQAAARTMFWTRYSDAPSHACEVDGCRLTLAAHTPAFLVASRTGAELLLKAEPQAAGAGVLRWAGRSSIELPAASASVVHSFGTGCHDWTARASLDTAARWTPFEGGAARFVAAPGAPVLLASAASGAPPGGVPSPACVALAERFVVAVHQCDFAVFVRRDKNPLWPRDAATALPQPSREQLPDLLQFTTRDIALDCYDLHVRRAADSLFCTIRFRNVQLKNDLRGWYLVGRATDTELPYVEFDFGSQHIREEAIYFSDWCQACNASVADDMPLPEEVAAIVLDEMPAASRPAWAPAWDKRPGRQSFREYVDVLLAHPNFAAFRKSASAKGAPAARCGSMSTPAYQQAGATRLLFKLTPGHKLPLGLAAMLDWDDASKRRHGVALLTSVFSERSAKRGELHLEDRSLDMRISDPMSIASDKKVGVAYPQEWATRIEAPALLVVNPVPGIDGGFPQWSRSKPAQDFTERGFRVAELWSVRMQRIGVRALFSDKVRREADGTVRPFDVPKPYHPTFAGQNDFRASYDARDLHELVCLTGVYGYGALCGSDQVQGCGPLKSPSVNERDEQDPAQKFKAGEFMPKPMDADLLLVSSLGASFKYRGEWAPPASKDSTGALTVKHYDHRVQLGRDTFARIEYKGFLFPLGQPAVLVKLTDRRFCLEGKRWVARLVQRFFIHVPAFTRAFPGTGQPHERLWGHIQTGMETFTTPDLEEPTQSEIVRGIGIGAFWPRVRGEVGANEVQDVLFDYFDETTLTKYTGPLIFVDNNVAHRTSELVKVVNYWRAATVRGIALLQRAWPPGTQRQPRHFAGVTSAKLPYLPGERGENSDIETSQILLGVAVPGDDAYNDAAVTDASLLRVTARMEAQDQPPFYPVRRRAEVTSTQLAVLTGNHAARFLLEFDPVYLRHGLAADYNAASIFGRFALQSPKMNFGDDTSRSGGFASPSASIVWMSKVRGPVGGAADQLATIDPQPRPVALVNARVLSKGALHDLARRRKRLRMLAADEPAHSDDFDPKEYFAQALGDAKLLGVVRLVDVLEVLLLATGTRIPTINKQTLYDVALPALRAIVDVLKKADGKVTDLLKAAGGDSMQDKAAERLRPHWVRVSSAVATAEALVAQSAPDPGAIISASNEIGSACDRFAAAVRELVDNPTVLLPDALREFIAQADSAFEQLKKLIPPTAIKEAVQNVAGQILRDKLRTTLQSIVDDLQGRAAYVSVRESLVRVLGIVDELLGMAQDEQQMAQRLLDALRSELFARLEAVVLELAGQLDSLALISGDAACDNDFTTPLTGFVKANAAALAAKTKDSGDRCIAVANAIEDTFGAIQAANAAAEPALRAARHSAMALQNVLNLEADGLSHIQAKLRHVQAWRGPCDIEGNKEALGAVIGVVEHFVQAPERAMKCLRHVQEIAKELPGEYVALATVVVRNIDPDVVAECGKVLAKWKGFMPTDALKGIIGEAADHVALLGNRVAELYTFAHSVEAVRLELKKAVVSGVAAAIQAARARLQTAEQTLTNAVDDTLARAGVYVLALEDAVAAAQMLTAAMRTFSPEAVEAAARTAIEAKLRAVRQQVEATLRGAVQAQMRVARDRLCAALQAPAAGATQPAIVLALDKAIAASSAYLSREALGALQDARDAATGCTSLEIPQIVAPFQRAYDLLSKTIASGDMGKLVDLEKVIEEIIAQLGIPTRIRLDYDWNTTVTETPKGSGAIFEPLGERRLIIKSVIEVSLSGGKPSVSLEAKLDPFAIHLFGKTGAANFLSIEFDSLLLKAEPGQALDCKTDVTLVKPGAALGFVQRLSAIFGGRSGFYLLPGLRGIEVGYKYSKPYDVLGGFVIQNLDFSIGASLPFDNAPVRTTLKLAEKEKPFLISAGIYGGGGFLAVRTRADTLELLEASFEYGAVTGFGFGPVTGSGRITAGIYIRMGGRNPAVEGFFCAAGEANVAGLIDVAAMLRVFIKFNPSSGETAGGAEFTFKFSLGIIDYEYSADVAYAKAGDGGGGGGAQAALANERPLMLAVGPSGTVSDAPGPLHTLLGSNDTVDPATWGPHRGLLQWAAWRRYWAAFLPTRRPARPAWMTVCRPAEGGPRSKLDETAFENTSKKQLEMVRWLVVPWGVDGGKLKASLRATPTVTDAKCGARRNWPELVAASGIATVAFGPSSSASSPVDLAAAYRAQLDAMGLTIEQAGALWRAAFPDRLPTPTKEPSRVRSALATEALSTREISNVTTLRVGELFADALGNLDGDAPGRQRLFVLPSTPSADVVRGLDGLARMYPSVASRRGEAESPLSTEALQHIRGGPRVTDLLAQLLLDRQGSFQPQLKGLPLQPAATEEADARRADNFHKRLAGVAANPWLMKALGLVIEVHVNVAATGGEPPWAMLTKWGPAVQPRHMQKTHLANGFAARHEGDTTLYRTSGVLDVSYTGAHGRFGLSQLDIDRTPHRLVQTAISWRNAVITGTPPRDITAPVQPQESVGLSLFKFKDPDFRNLTAAKVAEVEDIYLHNLVIGLRPDIQELVPEQDPAGARVKAWTSLTARRIKRVRLKGRDITDWFTNILGHVDENFLVEVQRRQNPGDAPKTEAELMRWDTWVLGVPRPDSEGAPLADLPKDTPRQSPGPGSDLKIEYEALPGATAQRFGHGYRVGVRLAMADGNSIAIDEAEARLYHHNAAGPSHSLGDESANEKEEGYAPFLRYEPIQPPAVLIEGLSRHNELLAERAHRAVVTLGEKTRCRRVLVPPRCASLDLAIRHGVFDDPRFAQSAPAGAFGHAMLTPEGDFPAFNYAAYGIGDSKRNTSERYFRRHAGGVQPPKIPYYPDPWARRAIIGFYREGDDQLMYVDHFDYYGEGAAWPYARELVIEIVPVESVPNPSRSRGFDVERADGRLIVRVAPGTHLKLRTWHEIDVDMLNQSGIVDQIVQAACDPSTGAAIRRGLRCTTQEPRELRARVIERLSNWHARRENLATPPRPAGQPSALVNFASFWMLNPLQEMDVVHATALPAYAPTLVDSTKREVVAPQVAHSPSVTAGVEEPFTVTRFVNLSTAYFRGHVRLDRATTRNIDAQATWRENGMRGVPAAGKRVTRVEKRQGLLFQLRDIAPVARDATGFPADVPLPPELPPTQFLQDVGASLPRRPDIRLDCGRSENAADCRPVATPYDFGDPRARVIEVELHALARHGVEFRDSASHPQRHVAKSKPQRVVVAATARPEPPKVEYVVPLIHAKDGTEGDNVVHTREGGWFRVWLGDEWYSSGNGELLAIVCWDSNLLDPLERRLQLTRRRETASQFAVPHKAIEPMVTRWGLDPLLGEPIEFGNMPASALRNRIVSRARLAASAATKDEALEADLHHLLDIHSFEPQYDLLHLPDAPPRPAGPADTTAVLALYRPNLDPESGRYYADIQIDPGYARDPFVRLALARWQPHALRDAKLDLRMSAVVATEFVQLMPGRSVSVTPVRSTKAKHRGFKVAVAGGLLDPAASAQSQLRLHVEKHHGDRAGGTWIPMGHQARPAVAAGVCEAQFDIPDDRDARYSVVIEEYQVLPASPYMDPALDARGDKRFERLVYFDRLALGGGAAPFERSTV